MLSDLSTAAVKQKRRTWTPRGLDLDNVRDLPHIIWKANAKLENH